VRRGYETLWVTVPVYRPAAAPVTSTFSCGRNVAAFTVVELDCRITLPLATGDDARELMVDWPAPVSPPVRSEALAAVGALGTEKVALDAGTVGDEPPVSVKPLLAEALTLQPEEEVRPSRTVVAPRGTATDFALSVPVETGANAVLLTPTAAGVVTIEMLPASGRTVKATVVLPVHWSSGGFAPQAANAGAANPAPAATAAAARARTRALRMGAPGCRSDITVVVTYCFGRRMTQAYDKS
jgi:hypothetical protein